MKKHLKLVRSQLASFQAVASRFPKSDGYKGFVYDLQQQEANLANQIGRSPKAKPKPSRKK